ncbi:MAG TPA: hypothetical protein PLE00_01920 [Anaerolineaceae bacterium]|nr:hypothetical protein [Anaerolineaceae bacterium]
MTPSVNSTKRNHAIIHHKQAERRKTVPYDDHLPRHAGLAQKYALVEILS